MISIVIPTFNRGHNLRKCLTALSKQTYKDFEIIISDDASTDTSPVLINEFKEVFKNFKYLYSNYRPQWDCARPRNLAIKLAVGELIVVLDSDIILTEKALEYYWEDYKKNPNRIILGRYDWMNTNNFDERNILMQEVNILCGRPEFLLIPEYRKEVFESITSDKLFYSYPHAINCLGGNIGIPRKVFDQLGLFDENMAMVEDGDFGIRSWKKQIAKSYDNRIRGWHLSHEIDPQRNLKAAEQLRKLNKKHFNKESISIEEILASGNKYLETDKKEDSK